MSFSFYLFSNLFFAGIYCSTDHKEPRHLLLNEEESSACSSLKLKSGDHNQGLGLSMETICFVSEIFFKADDFFKEHERYEQFLRQVEKVSQKSDAYFVNQGEKKSCLETLEGDYSYDNSLGTTFNFHDRIIKKLEDFLKSMELPEEMRNPDNCFNSDTILDSIKSLKSEAENSRNEIIKMLEEFLTEKRKIKKQKIHPPQMQLLKVDINWV